ncbi:MAG: hypothetical protein S4CHLAM7_07050 [Chlamydiae bacterium]|nr:hypothetical protein [Chlamydiota bacterium]
MRRLAYMYIIRPNARDSAGNSMPNFTFHRNEAVSFLEGGCISYTFLQRATEAGRMDAVKSLLRGVGVNINAPNEQGVILLHRAVQDMRIDIVRALLEAPGINLNIPDLWGNTALHNAAGAGYIDVVRALLAAREINVNIQNKLGETVLDYSDRERHVNVSGILRDKLL